MATTNPYLSMAPAQLMDTWGQTLDKRNFVAPSSQAYQDYMGQVNQMSDAWGQMASNGVQAPAYQQNSIWADDGSGLKPKYAGTTESTVPMLSGVIQQPSKAAQSVSTQLAQQAPQTAPQPTQQANPYLAGSTGAPAASQYTAPQVATSAGQANPYLPDIGNAITGAVNQNLMQNIMPAINRNSVATGGYGGSRQGVAQGVAAGNASTGLSQALASMYGGAWDSQQARDLSKYGMDQSNATSRYGIDTTAGTSKYLGDLSASTSRYGTDVGAQTTKYGYDTNAATSKYGTDSSSQIQNRNIDLNQNQQGYNQFWDTINNQLGLGKAQTTVGNEQYAAGKDPLNTYSNLVNPYTGLGGTKTTTDPATGGGAAGALGGAMSMAQLYDLIFGGKKP